MNHGHSYKRTLCNSQGNAVGLWKDLQEISLTKKKRRCRTLCITWSHLCTFNEVSEYIIKKKFIALQKKFNNSSLYREGLRLGGKGEGTGPHILCYSFLKHIHAFILFKKLKPSNQLSMKLGSKVKTDEILRNVRMVFTPLQQSFKHTEFSFSLLLSLPACP